MIVLSRVNFDLYVQFDTALVDLLDLASSGDFHPQSRVVGALESSGQYGQNAKRQRRVNRKPTA